MDEVALRLGMVGDVFGIGGVLLGFCMLDRYAVRVVLGLGCVEVGLDRDGVSVVMDMPSLNGDGWTLF